MATSGHMVAQSEVNCARGLAADLGCQAVHLAGRPPGVVSYTAVANSKCILWAICIVYRVCLFSLAALFFLGPSHPARLHPMASNEDGRTHLCFYQLP